MPWQPLPITTKAGDQYPHQITSVSALGRYIFSFSVINDKNEGPEEVLWSPSQVFTYRSQPWQCHHKKTVPVLERPGSYFALRKLQSSKIRTKNKQQWIKWGIPHAPHYFAALYGTHPEWTPWKSKCPPPLPPSALQSKVAHRLRILRNITKK